MKSVIVVPETPDFQLPVSHDRIVWINIACGVPKLRERQAEYLAPYWIHEGGARCIYHILGYTVNSENTEIRLGNSFVLPELWNHIGNPRKFEYQPLNAFGMEESCEGILRPLLRPE